MQIKATMRCCLIPSILAKMETTPSADKDEKQKEVSRAAGRRRKCDTWEKAFKIKLTVTI